MAAGATTPAATIRAAGAPLWTRDPRPRRRRHRGRGAAGLRPRGHPAGLAGRRRGFTRVGPSGRATRCWCWATRKACRPIRRASRSCARARIARRSTRRQRLADLPARLPVFPGNSGGPVFACRPRRPGHAEVRRAAGLHPAGRAEQRAAGDRHRHRGAVRETWCSWTAPPPTSPGPPPRPPSPKAPPPPRRARTSWLGWAKGLGLTRRLAAAVRAARRVPISRGSWFHTGSSICRSDQSVPKTPAAIRILTDAAFKDVPHSDQTEAKIVEALRTAQALTLSLVAVQDGEIVGHVAFSPVRINGVADDWYGLGPVSVRPGGQREGIGQALIRDGLHRLEIRRRRGVCRSWPPAYYARFGFEYDPELRYGDAPPGYFQRLTLSGSPPKGEVTYHPGFGAS